jgi:hypothetical protein
MDDHIEELNRLVEDWATAETHADATSLGRPSTRNGPPRTHPSRWVSRTGPTT